MIGRNRTDQRGVPRVEVDVQKVEEVDSQEETTEEATNVATTEAVTVAAIAVASISIRATALQKWSASPRTRAKSRP